MKLKAIKQMIKNGVAIDITNYSLKQINTLRPNLTAVKLSFGKYGANGAVFKSKDNKIYAIRARNTNLAALV